MLRVSVRNKLFANDALRGVLAGGIYPLDDSQPSSLDKRAFPAAWASSGDLLPTALVQDAGLFPFGPLPHSGKALIRVLFWQQRGRDAIKTALVETFRAMNGAGGSTTDLFVYRFKFAGLGPELQDPALANAEHGWIDFQAEVLIIGRQ